MLEPKRINLSREDFYKQYPALSAMLKRKFELQMCFDDYKERIKPYKEEMQKAETIAELQAIIKVMTAKAKGNDIETWYIDVAGIEVLLGENCEY